MTKAMNIGVVLGVVLGTVVAARADAFAVKDLDSYEKCLQLDHMIETVNTDKGSQTRLLTEAEIQLRCVEGAVKLLSGSKNKDLMIDFVKATKRLSAPLNALDLISVLVNTSINSCNEMQIYEVLTMGLSGGPGGSLDKSRSIIKRCLKDAEFRKDFMDEKDSSDAAVAANACQILVEEKLVKSCKGKK